ncbi:OLC1v1009124C1 [Oldenlandia corymbosa var. corymbosa]|uniref:OLC1v1009124C1 n=1 Tax=Oldenlandia corymbosa var. corymbosa TaxID=529605 RepID=A0AAV1DQK5_OLDCO|nr:OLC1v1009124C1 [Oldenlandia corymbosa var. corymbosa]
MASIGASYANLRVQQKRQEEKLKRKEEERARKNGGSSVGNIISNNPDTKSNRVFPSAGGSFGYDANSELGFGSRND